MDLGTASTIVACLGTGAGSFIGGRLSGRSVASQIANTTVNMLQAQVESLKEDKETRDLELSDLRTRVTVLEGLVTQRAEVEAVGSKVALVHEVVNRIDSRLVQAAALQPGAGV